MEENSKPFYEIGLRLTDSLKKFFKDNNIEYKKGRKENSIFIIYQGVEYRIHKSKKVSLNDQFAEYKYVFFCKPRKNGNKECNRSMVITQKVPGRYGRVGISIEGSHSPECFKPVKKKRRRRRKKQVKNLGAEEVEGGGMEDDNVMDNVIVDTGSSGMGYGGNSPQNTYFQRDNSPSMNPSSIPRPPTDRYPFNPNNMMLSRPQPQQQQRMNPQYLNQKPPPPQQLLHHFHQPPPSQEQPQPHHFQQPRKKQIESPLQEEDTFSLEEEDHQYTFGLNLDDLFYPQSIVDEKVKYYGGGKPTFPYYAGSTMDRISPDLLSTTPRSPVHSPPNMIFDDGDNNNNNNELSSPHPPPPPPSSSSSNTNNNNTLEDEEEDFVMDDIFRTNQVVFQKPTQQPQIHRHQPQPQPQPQPQQQQQRTTTSKNNIESVVPNEGVEKGGKLIRIFCNFGREVINSSPRFEVIFGSESAKVITFVPSHTLQDEEVSMGHWRSSNSVILVISPSSFMRDTDRVRVMVNVYESNSNRYICTVQKPKAFRYLTTINMSGYYGA